jgi:hypothetical protein
MVVVGHRGGNCFSLFVCESISSSSHPAGRQSTMDLAQELGFNLLSVTLARKANSVGRSLLVRPLNEV